MESLALGSVRLTRAPRVIPAKAGIEPASPETNAAAMHRLFFDPRMQATGAIQREVRIRSAEFKKRRAPPLDPPSALPQRARVGRAARLGFQKSRQDELRGEHVDALFTTLAREPRLLEHLFRLE